MKNKKGINDISILATDFSKLDQEMKDWKNQREKKGNIYKAFSEYIECLEASLILETDSYRRYSIEKEIKKLKKEQKKYYVPSILGLDLGKRDDRLHNSLKKSSYRLVKKLNKIEGFGNNNE